MHGATWGTLAGCWRHSEPGGGFRRNGLPLSWTLPQPANPANDGPKRLHAWCQSHPARWPTTRPDHYNGGDSGTNTGSGPTNGVRSPQGGGQPPRRGMRRASVSSRWWVTTGCTGPRVYPDTAPGVGLVGTMG